MRTEQVEIKKLGINGEGIGYIQKKICFINNALPGEIVKIEITQNHQKFLKGKVLQYIQKSKYRQNSICPIDDMCLGCSLTQLQYSQHLDYKQNVLKDALKKYTSLSVDRLPIKKTIGAKQTQGYKQVVSLPIAYFQGKVRAGIYQRESKYLTLMDECAMHDPLINECLKKIEDILNEYHVRDYNEKVKKGLRFLRIRNIRGKIQILFVCGQDGLKDEVVSQVSQIDAVSSIWMTINTTRYQEFELQGYKKLYGQSKLEYMYANQQYLYSVKSEFPINIEMEVKKLDMIRSMIPPQGNVLSLHCGIGLLELALDNPTIAIDEKNYHISDAKDNAKFLHKDHVEFKCKKVDEAVILECKKKSFDHVVVRAEALSPAMIQSFILSKVKHIIFVCDHPSSLAKNIEDLKELYHIETIIPMDTYPYSSKFDTIVEMTRK